MCGYIFQSNDQEMTSWVPVILTMLLVPRILVVGSGARGLKEDDLGEGNTNEYKVLFYFTCTWWAPPDLFC